MVALPLQSTIDRTVCHEWFTPDTSVDREGRIIWHVALDDYLQWHRRSLLDRLGFNYGNPAHAPTESEESFIRVELRLLDKLTMQFYQGSFDATRLSDYEFVWWRWWCYCAFLEKYVSEPQQFHALGLMVLRERNDALRVAVGGRS